jgi:hypothetical protein
MNFEVRVSKKGPASNPQAEILVDGKISSAQLGTLIQKVTTSKSVLTAAGLRACAGCKSGLDLNIRDRFQEVVNVELEG